MHLQVKRTPEAARYHNRAQEGPRNDSRELEVIVLVNLDSVVEEVVGGLDVETLLHFGKGTDYNLAVRQRTQWPHREQTR